MTREHGKMAKVWICILTFNCAIGGIHGAKQPAPVKLTPVPDGVNYVATAPELLLIPKYSTFDMHFSDDACWLPGNVTEMRVLSEASEEINDLGIIIENQNANTNARNGDTNPSKVEKSLKSAAEIEAQKQKGLIDKAFVPKGPKCDRLQNTLKQRRGVHPKRILAEKKLSLLANAADKRREKRLKRRKRELLVEYAVDSEVDESEEGVEKALTTIAAPPRATSEGYDEEAGEHRMLSQGHSSCRNECYKSNTCMSYSYNATSNVCDLYDDHLRGAWKSRCLCENFIRWQVQYAEDLGMDKFSWRTARANKIQGECLPDRCSVRDMDRKKKWRFRVGFLCEVENKTISEYSPPSMIIRSMDLVPPANLLANMTDGSSSGSSDAALPTTTVLGDLGLWMRSEMGLATRIQEIATSMERESEMKMTGGTVQKIRSPFYYDLEYVLKTHIFHAQQYSLSLKVESVVQGTGLAGGLDLQNTMKIDERTILSLVAGGETPNLSHGYIKARAVFEVYGGISYLEFKQTEEFIRTHLHSRIWTRDGLTPLTVALSIPQLEFSALVAATAPPETTIVGSVLGGDAVQKISVTRAGSTLQTILLMIFLGSVLHLIFTFIYWLLFVEWAAFDAQEILPWQFYFCWCNRIPHNHYLLSKNTGHDASFWYYWIRCNACFCCCPVIGPAFLQMRWALELDMLNQKGHVPGSQEFGETKPGLTRQFTTLLRKNRIVSQYKTKVSAKLNEQRKSNVKNLRTQLSVGFKTKGMFGGGKRRDDYALEVCVPMPVIPERKWGQTNASYMQVVLKALNKDQFIQLCKHVWSSVYFITWIFGDWDYTDRTNRMVVVGVDEAKAAAKARARAEAARKAETVNYATHAFLQSVMLKKSDRALQEKEDKKQLKKTKSMQLALTDGTGGGEMALAIPRSGEAGGAKSSNDEEDKQSNTGTSLSKEDMEYVKTKRKKQWGNRWLLFANPKTNQLYWYNRDTKIQVPVPSKYCADTMRPPWEEESSLGDDGDGDNFFLHSQHCDAEGDAGMFADFGKLSPPEQQQMSD